MHGTMKSGLGADVIVLPISLVDTVSTVIARLPVGDVILCAVSLTDQYSRIAAIADAAFLTAPVVCFEVGKPHGFVVAPSWVGYCKHILQRNGASAAPPAAPPLAAPPLAAPPPAAPHGLPLAEELAGLSEWVSEFEIAANHAFVTAPTSHHDTTQSASEVQPPYAPRYASIHL